MCCAVTAMDDQTAAALAGSMVDCPGCNATGEVWIVNPWQGPEFDESHPCPTCMGRGEVRYPDLRWLRPEQDRCRLLQKVKGSDNFEWRCEA